MEEWDRQTAEIIIFFGVFVFSGGATVNN